MKSILYTGSKIKRRRHIPPRLNIKRILESGITSGGHWRSFALLTKAVSCHLFLFNKRFNCEVRLLSDCDFYGDLWQDADSSRKFRLFCQDRKIRKCQGRETKKETKCWVRLTSKCLAPERIGENDDKNHLLHC